MPGTAFRLAIFRESVIREMTRLANQHQAINRAQGFPDFDPPDALGIGGDLEEFFTGERTVDQ